MNVEITLKLPEQLVLNAQRWGAATHQPLEDVLTETLEMTWPALEDNSLLLSFPPVSMLADGALLELADSKMDVTQNQRLGALQTKGKAIGLNVAERYELSALLHIYQLGQLRKSEALAEVVGRGLREPLAA